MASSICRKVLPIASKLPKMAQSQASLMMRSSQLFASAVPRGSRGFQVLTSFKGTDLVPCALTPQKRLAHSEVTAEMSMFLEKEIKFEESSKLGKLASNLPKVRGFEVTECTGTSVVLERKLEKPGEAVVVHVDVNGSVGSDIPDENEMQEKGKEELLQMVSRPPFKVEIRKGPAPHLCFTCTFPSSDEIEESMEQDEETFVDHFDIQEVYLGEEGTTSPVYCLMSDTMDGTLYDLLMDMLDEHGIGDEFAQQLVEFCTAYEHSLYLDFLKQLKAFVAK